MAIPLRYDSVQQKRVTEARAEEHNAFSGSHNSPSEQRNHQRDHDARANRLANQTRRR
jgi:hypothetical protein